MWKSSMRIALPLAAVVIAAGSLRLRAQVTPELVLVRTDKVPISEIVPRYIFVPPHCDGEGNTYFRFSSSHSASSNPPVTKISSTGQVLAKFDLASVPDSTLTEGAVVREFAVDTRERVHLLAGKEDVAFIFVFAASGAYESLVKLDLPGFFPSNLVVFPAGTFLVSGVLQREGTVPPAGRLFTAVFDDSGQMLKEVSLPPGSWAEKHVPIPWAQMKDGPRRVSYAAMFDDVEPHTASLGDDDNAYLIAKSSALAVYVIASDGTVVRTLKIAPPERGVIALMPVEISGKLVIPFARRLDRSSMKIVQFMVYDASSGEVLIKYRLSGCGFGYLSCSTPDMFTYFAETAGGHASLVHAAPR